MRGLPLRSTLESKYLWRADVANLRSLRLCIFGLLIVATACGDDDGTPTTDGGGECAGQVDGEECGDDAGTRRICLGGECVASTCGDGYVDAEAGEQCEDGNGQAGDGCEPGDCSFTCEADTDCSDDNPCTGEETCSISTNRCIMGAPPTGTTMCTQDGGEMGVCRGSDCVPEGCGDGNLDMATEECDDGNEIEGDGCDGDCTFSCTVAADCNDGNMCNGEETCSSNACVPGTALNCMDDMDPCTEAICVPETGCGQQVIDNDGDGFASTDIDPSCGDCDDTNDLIYTGAVEICGDGLDNNCSGDNSDETPTIWYADCDADGYAPLGATQRTACDMPGTTAAVTGCATDNGDWTVRNPANASQRDCDDDERNARPNQEVAQTGLVPATGTGDWNCDGTARQTLDPPCSTIFCLRCILIIGGEVTCPETGGGFWRDVSEVPCGTSGWWEYCGDETTRPECRNDVFRAQECI